MKLSILIPSLYARNIYYSRVWNEIWRQIADCDALQTVEVIAQVDDGEQSIGVKRNLLIEQAKGQYIAFVDDDDMVTDCYIQKLLEVCDSGMDCGSLRGLYFENSVYDRPFFHNLNYKEWFSNDFGHYRNPNHLNCIKREIMLQVPFPDKSFGEDHDQSKRLLASGLLKTQYDIKETLYLYYKRTA